MKNKGTILKLIGFGITVLGGIVTMLQDNAEEARQEQIIDEKVKAALNKRGDIDA